MIDLFKKEKKDNSDLSLIAEADSVKKTLYTKKFYYLMDSRGKEHILEDPLYTDRNSSSAARTLFKNFLSKYSILLEPDNVIEFCIKDNKNEIRKYIGYYKKMYPTSFKNIPKYLKNRMEKDNRDYYLKLEIEYIGKLKEVSNVRKIEEYI